MSVPPSLRASAAPASGSRGNVKGGILRSRLSYIEKHGGEAALEKVLAKMAPNYRQMLEGIILAVSWYPFELNAELDRAIANTFGGGRAILRSMGAQSAKDSLGASHKNLIRDRNPQGLLKHAAQIHNLYYDTGRRTYEELGETSAVLRTYDCKSFSEDDCLTNLGWHEMAISMCGGMTPRVTDPKCRARGDDVCEYLCKWE